MKLTEGQGEGDCYDANGRKVLFELPDGFELCHGVAILVSDGKPFGHCWIEKNGKALDFSNGRQMILPISTYYKAGRMPVKGWEKIHRYTKREMAKKVAQTGHWGPWDYNPPR